MDIDLGEMLRDSRCISNRLHRRGSRALAEQGVTDVQARVILYLLKHADTGASLTDVHRELHFSMAAASGLIKRLREKGYIRVEACALDERRKLLYVTEKGSRVREVLDSTLRAIPYQLYRGFTEEEVATLHRLQKKMLRNLEQSET
ncbi:MAG TPA: winged helix DNA-binding protein [Candidatus Scatomorpha merdipullorum]|uniref:Winged helix DNA-binding protein n=1 Tax=Candidatus Scatomorpha merdipullorum TaxID=2840927 RepID=A0A9D1FDJ1_9FIRM|nr:winged helix DNA-binding protein [Candidatus Scatomorpha merdipullorum]